MIGAAFSLPLVQKSVESTLRLPRSIKAWGTCVIARPSVAASDDAPWNVGRLRQVRRCKGGGICNQEAQP